MRQLQKAFINELGNPIVVTIEDAVDDQVLVALEGPTSLGEQIITLREAEVLHDLLGRYLQVRKFMEK
ncbi:hypothetical protein Ccr2_gp039c [Caulobacter phage Ccr2]|uniref:Uncharacterized protein n=5 Tax=Viruses TaxID=10239 RepID=J3SMP8_9CAUD|nr:hypothetical protein D865_gp040 [Caulobacter phage phiCbK]YP_006988720.1 hypothetical protein CcrMagneto_gp038 [Caulobacter virus Magneto]ARB13568.1 hypothetical protein Ccr10_gp040c [Caulobacter phage Ccr10]ARB13914.1 hypothetical protein Ccr2_gp039c [Caulobacter phage Ccr2]ARB14603.1 hypothetical protein Ccr29_gp046 [Caulobacter phage Ccr29]ARB14959.1 hypothetical protein Ccr32_gp040 [Caulobacter phage Ccr32]ARB15290.1 hypothetical protein Ccr34_gp041 [Caulobacter phage Ccr34]